MGISEVLEFLSAMGEIEIFISQTFLSLSDKDVLIFNTIPEQSENLVAGFLKENKPC